MTPVVCSITPAPRHGLRAPLPSTRPMGRLPRSVIRTATAGFFKRSRRAFRGVDPTETDGGRVGPLDQQEGFPMPTTYDSADELATALRRAAAAHGRHEEEIGHADPDWPDWY